MSEEEKKLYEEFQEKFPIEHLSLMTLEEYVNDKDKDGFLWWMLKTFGNLGSFYKSNKVNFGIYKCGQNPKYGTLKEDKHGFEAPYVWNKDFGDNTDKAFETIKKTIIKIAQEAQQLPMDRQINDEDIKGILQRIDKINFPSSLKWKIAFLYSGRELIDCYSVDKLKELFQKLLPKEKIPQTISDLQYQLVKIKNEKPDEFEEKFATLWPPKNKNNNNNNEDKTMLDTNNNASVLAKNLAELLKNTKNIILHGAPGTGKTYLAKDIAAYMNFGKLHSKLNDEEEKKFSEYTGFVQFHPSYDYTDFVEGIRPTPDGKFNLEDGIFKKFCEKAINNSENTQKNTTDANSSYSNLLEALEHFVKELEDLYFIQKINKDLYTNVELLKSHLQALKSSKNNKSLSKNLYLLKIELDWIGNKIAVSSLSNSYKNLTNIKEELQNCINNLNIQNDLSTCWYLLIHEVSKHNINNPLKIDKYYFIKSPKAESLKKLNKERTDVINTTIPLKRIKEVYEGKSDSKKYYHQPGKSIIDYMSKYKLESYEALQLADDAFNESTKKTPEHSENKNSFIFIIDEINRGEISKIFGELFFAIDPGYRGAEKCKDLRTQYANMQNTPNKFDEALKITGSNNFGHFFVPDNVYIIGTMNDIDRSVESMDFAMRRRFTFKEIKAKDTQSEILSSLDEKCREKAKICMDALNNAIWNEDNKNGTEGLSSAYHIGAAYFLKLNNFDGEPTEKFNKLWKYHLDPLLKEYLRGMEDAESSLSNLHDAYFNSIKTQENNNNQES